jgi:NTP pyrophosphatase (non-canonical NTP hydrolase)
MNMNEYQKLAQRTANTKLPSAKIENGILGLNGESGECADIVKKCLFQGHELDREKLIEELGDVLWYCAELAAGLGVGLEEVARRNIDKLRRRYPEGFDPERSVNRE